MSEIKEQVCEETESREMYLKTIYLLSKQNKLVTGSAIAVELKYSKPSVSRMLKFLRIDGYVLYDEKNGVRLTEKGYEMAKRLNEKYEFFHDRLVSRGVAPDRAYETACKMEHVIPDDVYETLKAHAAMNGA